MAIQTGVVTATDQQAITAQEVTALKTALALETVTNQVVQDNTNKRTYPLADELKLATIEENATENQTDAFLLNRANHTGTQPSMTITYQIISENKTGAFALATNVPTLFWNLTGNSTIVTTSIPNVNNSIVLNIIVNTQSGTQTLSFPVSWVIYGTFDPSKENLLTILITNTGALGVRVFINQPN